MPFVAMESLLERARRVGDGPLVVKIDAEGAECEIVLGTPHQSWHGVRELFVEIHESAPCGSDEVTEHLTASGLELAPSKAPVLRFRRPGRADRARG